MAENEPKDSRKTRYTRTALRDSLIELMQSRSILRISVKEICGGADISRSTFYAYYRDQYDLLRSIEDETLASLEGTLKKYDDKEDVRDLTLMVEEILRYIACNSDSIQVLLSENGDINFQKRFFRRFTGRQKMMRYLPEKIADEGKNEYYLVFSINGSIALVQYWLKNDMDIAIPELAAMVVNLTKWKD
jgi:AcrR family transcriptional regulator